MDPLFLGGSIALIGLALYLPHGADQGGGGRAVMATDEETGALLLAGSL